MSTMELITKLKVNYEDLCQIVNEIKKNYINKYLFTFNESSNAFIDKIIYNVLPNVFRLDKNNEQKLKILGKYLIKNNFGKKENEEEEEEEDKSKQFRKKIFNNIKMMIYERKEKDIKFHLNY